MKIKYANKPEGGTLLVTLMTIIILSISLSSYLALVSNQNSSVARAQAWNAAIPVMESGIEEALTQIHYNGATNLSPNGWTYGSDNLYHKTRSFADGSYYTVSIQPTNPPVLVSTGYVVVSWTANSTNYVARKVRVNTIKPRPQGGGINAKGNISFSGGSYLDSFDSSDPSYSTGGMYDPSKRKDNGKVLTDSGASGAIQLGTVYGSVATGPTGTASGGTVGDAAWVANHSGIQDGHIANDANVQFNDEPAPFLLGSGLVPVPGDLGTTNFQYYLGSGNYNVVGSISLNGKRNMVVTGDAVLYVSGDFSIGGSAFVYIAPGASLKLYIGGSGSFDGGGVVNDTGRAANLSIYGLASCKSIDVGGNTAFVGTIYAPEADFSFHGTAGASGAFTANTVSLVGGAAIHYDEALGLLGKDFVVTSWNEF